MKKSLVGAIIFSLLGATPYVILYVYFNIPWAFLTFIIGICTFVGYRLFKGKVNKESKSIILYVSIVATLIVTLLIIPSLLIVNKNMGNITTILPILYKTSEFLLRLFRDIVIGLIFVIFSVHMIYRNMEISKETSNIENNKATKKINNKKKNK